jgi:hypothetical protein
MIYRYKSRNYSPGDFFFHDSVVYEVIQEHQGGDDIIPAIRPDLYKPLISLEEL